jgi:hypothetical protein
MITRIFPRPLEEEMLIEDDAGRRYHVAKALLAEVEAAHMALLTDAAEDWELVDDSPGGASSEASSDEAVVTIMAIEPADSGEMFGGRTGSNAEMLLTAAELKTIVNAIGIHNAKIRGVEP